MKARQLENMGFDPAMAKMAKWCAAEAHRAGLDRDTVKARMETLLRDPESMRGDPHFGQLATAIAQRRQQDANAARQAVRAEPAPWRQWGEDIDPPAIEQMRNACRLPVAVAGALMPDAHVGYGLPIGGVLATDNAVIPYAVGVDIACRMKLSVLDLPPDTLDKRPDWLTEAIEAQTRFGVGAEFGKSGDPRSRPSGGNSAGGGASSGRRQHDVMDMDWSITPLLKHLKDKAHAQLGTSGSGNHFVEFGLFTANADGAAALQLPGAGVYLALLSHSGSRGAGAQVASHYSKLAQQLHPELPKELSYLAWLDMDSAEGQEYWLSMQLMGEYAAANHSLIHHHILRHLGARPLVQIENHHNFAWKERHVIDGAERELIVHRKGATPAGAGVLGVIPGSMAAPGYVVRGRGERQSLHSASHGAGRQMSRTQARNTYRWSSVRDHLAHRNVTVISAGVDEVPFVYKDIEKVMAQQADLVERLARFDPRLVKMAPEGEQPED